jgi:hypothetical protein
MATSCLGTLNTENWFPEAGFEPTKVLPVILQSWISRLLTPAAKSVKMAYSPAASNSQLKTSQPLAAEEPKPVFLK